MKYRCLIILCLALLFLAGIAMGEETTVIDNDNVSIHITGFEQNLLSYNMSVLLENKTDTPLTFTMGSTTVNGTEVPLLWAAEVPANTQKKSTVSWYDLKSVGIDGDILVISGSFRAYNNEDWSIPDAATQEFIVYPEEDNRVVIVDYNEGHDTGIVTVVDDDLYSITVDNYAVSSFLYCYGLTVTLENKADTNTMFSVRDVYVNGNSCDPFWAAELSPVEKRTEKIGWFAEAFEEYDIQTVYEIKMTFVAYDVGDLTGSYRLEKEVILNP